VTLIFRGESSWTLIVARARCGENAAGSTATETAA
jgi:hypothetical protein